MPTILITGASRGLGLAFAGQYASDGWKVIATCRHPETAADLKRLRGDVCLRRMDISDPAQIAEVAAEFGSVPIDVLLNNASIHGPKGPEASFGQIDTSAWMEVMRVNAMAPLKVVEAFLEQVRAGREKKIVFISSRAGSIAERGRLPHHQRGGPYIYRSSKAALNAVTQSLAFDLAPEGISVVVLHPGYVRTEMAGDDAEMDKDASVRAMRTIIGNFKPGDSQTFWNYNGESILW